MKKTIITLTLMLLVISTQAVDLGQMVDSTKALAIEIKNETVSTVNQLDTSSTFKQMWGDVKQGLVVLASNLKVGTEHVYYVLVKQQIAKAITFLIVGLIGFWMLMSFMNKFKSDEEWTERSGNFLSGIGIIRLIQVISSAVLLLIFIMHIDTVVTGFVNPEYGAIENIIDIVKSIK